MDAALCTGWTSRTLKTGLGILESVLVDPTGNGMLLSNTSQNSVERRAAGGTVTTVASLHPTRNGHQEPNECCFDVVHEGRRHDDAVVRHSVSSAPRR